jgi:hypothetical protein
MTSAHDTQVAIIGAGPYGLGVAAHLRSAGVDFRIFGKPLETWRAHMPQGMYLKSEGNASSLFEPSGAYTLKQYCAATALPYSDDRLPVSLENFLQYGLAFQRRFVPNVEDQKVTALERRSSRFELRLAGGESVRASKVVMAVGVSYAAHVPPELATLPAELVSHSGQHRDLGTFAGRHVTVVGAGQSALETAALLAEVGANVHLVARRASLAWNAPPTSGQRSLFQRLRRPASKLGPGLGPWLYSNAPMLYRYLPKKVRIARVKTVLGPAGAWWLKDRVLGHMPFLLGHSVQGAAARSGKAVLQLKSLQGECRELVTDHVIAGTGYRFRLASLPFLSESCLAQLRAVNETPVLSSSFESTLPGLYFTGLASANYFGPGMRFLVGAEHTARCIAGHLAVGKQHFPWPLFTRARQSPGVLVGETT